MALKRSALRTPKMPFEGQLLSAFQASVNIFLPTLHPSDLLGRLQTKKKLQPALHLCIHELVLLLFRVVVDLITYSPSLFLSLFVPFGLVYLSGFA